MVWSPSMANDKGEAAKCKYRVLPFMRGHGLDLGCGSYKVSSHAIGVDVREGSDVRLDCTDLSIFATGGLDFVFSSHLLEDIDNTVEALKEWLRVIKIGGYLILYLPHKDLYPRRGEPGANLWHLHDFEPDDIIKAIKKTNIPVRLLRSDVHAEENEYSFEMVFQKLHGNARFEKAIIKDPDNAVCVLRWGAFGDAVQVTPIIKRFHDEGYNVIVQTSVRGEQMLLHNPNIYRLDVIPQDSVPQEDYDDYWEKTARHYKKFVNLSGVVEQGLLKMPGEHYGEGYDWPHEKRHELLNVNYVEALHKRAGFDDHGGYVNMEVFFTESEEKWAKKQMERHRKDFFILWSLAGSGWNKKYPFFEFVARNILDQYPNVTIMSVGDDLCKLIEFDHPRLIKRCGVTTIRQSAILAKYADLVVGPETGILNVAGCFDNYKILLLSHSSPENLSKYWRNTLNLQPDCECHPCHRMIYSLDQCPIVHHIALFDPQTGEPILQKVIKREDRPEWIAQMQQQYPTARIAESSGVACMGKIEPEYLFSTIAYVINGRDLENGMAAN